MIKINKGEIAIPKNAKRTPKGLLMMAFTESYGSYSAGTRAAFSDAEARRLIDKGVATFSGNIRPAPPTDESNADIEFDVANEIDHGEDDPLADIRGNDDWKSLHGSKLIAIAKRLVPGDPIQNKLDAVSVIESALGIGAEEDNPETPEQAE